MKAKNIILFVLFGACLFVAGLGVGAFRARKVAQREETLFVLPTSYRAYKAAQRGDTERAKFLCGGLLAAYTENYDSLFPTGVQSARFERLLTDARQISQIVRTNILRRAFETNAEAE